MIRVVVDDLAFVEADAILRPADAALAPVTAAAARLDRQAGPRFESARRTTTPLSAGAAVVTAGGDLAAQFVLHVVLQDREAPASRDTVRRGLLSAWQRSAEWGLAVLAAPPIGAGAGLLDLEEAARLLVSTFPEGAAAPRELTIVVDRDADRETVEAALRSRPG